MAEDLAHKRPYLLGSLIAGISFPATWLFLPIDGGLYAIIWKMAAVGLLVPFALRRHHQGEFILLAIMFGRGIVCSFRPADLRRAWSALGIHHDGHRHLVSLLFRCAHDYGRRSADIG
jgi:hypothetical protein